MITADPLQSLRIFIDNEWPIFTLPLLTGVRLGEQRLKRVVHALVFSAAVVGGYATIQLFSGVEVFRGQQLSQFGGLFRASGAYNFYLTLAGNLLMIMAFAFAFFLLTDSGRGGKAFYLSCLILILAGIIATLGRSAWLGAMGVIGVGVLLTRPRAFGYAVLTIIIVIAIAAAISPEIQLRILSTFDPAANPDRLNLWHTTWNMIADNPIFGVGPGNYTRVFHLYEVPGLYDSKGHAHNDYLNVAANSGLPALAAWLLMWISWYYFCLKTYLNSALSTIEKQTLLGSILSITGILVAAVFQCYYTDLENNILWWYSAALGLNVMLRHNDAENTRHHD